MKLYRYYEDYGRMGSLEGLFIWSDSDFKKYYNKSFYWYELLGKYSEGEVSFTDETLTVIDIPEDVVDILLEAIGPVLSGPFPFEYFDEQLEEMKETEDDF